jgi:hypothetical protein
MIPFALPALGILRHWKLALAGAAVVALGIAAWRVSGFIEEYHRRGAELDRMAAVNAANLEALAAIEADRQAAESALATALEASGARRLELEALRKDINRAPSDQDGPLAPVLGDTLERLRAAPLAADQN